MADYDLISNSDYFSEEEKEKKQEEAPDLQPSPQTDEDDVFAKPESEQPPEPEPEIPSPPATEADFSEDVQRDLPMDEVPEQAEESVESTEPDRADLLEFIEEKQEGINYRPLIYIALVIILLIVGYFAVSKFLLGGKESAETEQAVAEKTKVEQPAKNAPSPEELKRKEFLSSVAATVQSNLNLLTNLSGVAGKKSRITSILLYNPDFLFQIFAPSRAELAKVNMNLRNQFSHYKISLISTEPRPGTNGILGLFKVDLSSAPPAGGGQQELSSLLETPQKAREWIDYLATNSGIKTKDFRFKNIGSKESFAVYEISSTITGSLSGCLAFLESMASSGKNVSIHKLNLTAQDQKTFNPKKYQLRIIFHLYAPSL